MTHPFSWYELRTTDVAAARAFYADAAELDIRPEAERLMVCAGDLTLGEISVLPERARALGAPAHWLGHIAVVDADECAAHFVAQGAERLGPARLLDGFLVQGLRDPLGAPVAVTSRPPAGEGARLAWHELHTTDHARAAALYASSFGWQLTHTVELGGALGTYQLFSFAGAAPDVGGMLSSARHPAIHPHWLYYFEVSDLDRALTRTELQGGKVLHSALSAPSGARVAQCEDPEGAVFGLRAAP